MAPIVKLIISIYTVKATIILKRDKTPTSKVAGKKQVRQRRT